MPQYTYTYPYPKASITVDIVALGISPEGQLEVATITRGEEPYKNYLALPGGFIELLKGETALEAAYREMEEETGVKIAHLEQLGTFDSPDRDPRERTFSIAHMALVRTRDYQLKAGSDAAYSQWVPVKRIQDPNERLHLAFDHAHILATAIERLRNKIRYVPIGFNLLPEKFTLTDLRKLYEIILGESLDVQNFRKKVFILNGKVQSEIDQSLLEEVGFENASAAQRTGPPAKLYKFNKTAYDLATKRGINFEI